MAAIEKKVQASTAASFVVSLVVVLLNAVAGHSQLLGSLPAWLQGLIIAIAPPLATFLAGWAAPHSPRIARAPEPPATASGVDKAA